MGFDVSMFDEPERSAVRELIDFGECSRESIVRLVLPAKVAGGKKNTSKGDS